MGQQSGTIAEVVPMKEERRLVGTASSHSRKKEHMADKQKSGRVSLAKTKKKVQNFTINHTCRSNSDFKYVQILYCRACSQLDWTIGVAFRG